MDIYRGYRKMQQDADELLYKSLVDYVLRVGNMQSSKLSTSRIKCLRGFIASLDPTEKMLRLSQINPEMAAILCEMKDRVADAEAAMQRTDKFSAEIKGRLDLLSELGLVGSTVDECLQLVADYDPLFAANLLHGLDMLGLPYEHIIVCKRDYQQAAMLILLLENRYTTADEPWSYILLDEDGEEFDQEHSCIYTVFTALWFAVLRSEARTAGSKIAASKKPYRDTAQVATMKEKVSSLNSELARMRRQRDSDVTSAVVPLEQQVARLKEQLAEKERENAELNERVSWLIDQQVLRDDAEQLDVEQLLELPTEGVTFVGGHVRVRKKLAELFPMWNIIGYSLLTDVIRTSPLVFCCTQSMSHKQFQTILAERGRDIIYCRGINMERLVLDMRREYTAYMRRRQGISEERSE